MKSSDRTPRVQTDEGRHITRLDYYLGITLLGGILLLGDWGIHHAQAGPTTPAVISAREFDVVDAAGHVEARLKSRTTDNTDTLEVSDEKGVKRFSMKAHADQGAAINLYGPEGTDRMTIATLDDSDQTNAVAMNKDGKAVMTAFTTKDNSGIEFWHPDGTTKVLNGQ